MRAPLCPPQCGSDDCGPFTSAFAKFFFQSPWSVDAIKKDDHRDWFGADWTADKERQSLRQLFDELCVDTANDDDDAVSLTSSLAETSSSGSSQHPARANHGNQTTILRDWQTNEMNE